MSNIKFRSEITIPINEHSIQHADRIISMGSCFAERIGHRMTQLKWDVLTNPLGIVYNPISLCKHLDYLIEQKELKSEELVNQHDIFHHFDFHSAFSSTSSFKSVEGINTALKRTAASLPEANWLFLTLGTAWVFRRRLDGSVVANCHKFPSTDFTQHLLTAREISDQLKESIKRLRQACPNIKIMLTVSPVRHLRHGMVDNNRSKSTLILAVHDIVDALDDIYYFPSYEIMMDDLRDYRFYEEDLIHPNQLALNYIWERFSESAFSESTKLLLNRIQNLKQRIEHRALDSDSNQHQDFIRITISQITELCATHDYMRWQQEISELKANMK